jgi:hypothetical protein
VPREHEREQLVAQLDVRQRRAVLMARLQQQRQDVPPVLEIGRALARADHPVGRRVEQPDRRLVQPDRLGLPGVGQVAELRHRRGREPDQAADRLAQAVLRRALRRLAVDAEDPGHDHVERDRLHARRERERLADRPAVDLAVRRRLDHRRVARDRLAVELRQQHLALAHVRLAECGQRGVRPDDRPQRGFACQRRRLVRLGGEQRAHVVGMRRHHRRALDHQRPHAEDLAVPAARARDERRVPQAEAHGLHRARHDDGGRRRQPVDPVVARTGWGRAGGRHAAECYISVTSMSGSAASPPPRSSPASAR